MKQLSHFDLSPLTKFDPSIFEQSSFVDRFVLSMAHAFNEMKFLFWAYETFLAAPDDLTVSPYGGQLHGMKNQVGRLVYACAHEVLLAVKKASHNQVFKDPLFNKVIDELDHVAKPRWSALVSAATTGKSEIKEFMYVLRNRLAFHYCDDENLAAGFQKFFRDNLRNDRNEFAYASLGDNMETTRFYFADAAAAAASELAGDVTANNSGRDVLGQINESIRFVVEGYIKAKESQLRVSAAAR